MLPSHPSRFPPALSLSRTSTLHPCFLNLVFSVQNHTHCHHHQRWRISFPHISSASWSKPCPVSQICILYMCVCVCVCVCVYTHTYTWASQVALVVKNPPVKAEDLKDVVLICRSKVASTLLRLGWDLWLYPKLVTNSLCAGGTLHRRQGEAPSWKIRSTRKYQYPYSRVSGE